MVKVAVTGAEGRMGNLIANLVLQDRDLKLVGVTERPDSDVIGKEFFEGINFYASIGDIPEKPDVVIDFTIPEATLRLLDEAREIGTALVIGTTGFTDEEKRKIEETAKTVPVVFSPNMSLGVNLLFKLVAEVTKALKDKGYDIEIFEIHHRFKKDAPSGTAMKIGEIVANVMGKDISTVGVFGRKGIIGERKKDEVGIMALRMGDIVGEHRIFFSTIGETIELSHRATSRETFAKGAITATKWIKGKPPGIYTMQDVLEG